MELKLIGLFAPKHTSRQILDFYHAAEYLTDVADAQFARDPRVRKQWLDDACTSLKHDPQGPQDLMAQMQGFLTGHLPPGPRSKIKAALTYFQNQQPLMNYALHLQQNWPLGSGVTEAACKTIVKQRLCCSGMKWKEAGAAIVLSLRTLVHSRGRWEQFWSKIDQYGFPVAA